MKTKAKAQPRRRHVCAQHLLIAALVSAASTPALAQTGQTLEQRPDAPPTSSPAAAGQVQGGATPVPADAGQIQGGPAPGPTQTFVLEPRIDASIWATDNLYGLPSGRREADVFFDVAPGINLRAVRPHFRAYLDYEIDAVKYIDHSNEDDVFHNLAHAGTWELYDGHFFIDTVANMDRQTIDPSTSLTVNERLQSRDATTVASYGLSPYLVNRFGNYANSELRYALRHVIPFDEDHASALNNHISANLVSGTYLTNFHWGLELEGQRVAYDSEDPTIDRMVRRERAEVSVAYDISRMVSLIGSFGAENYQDDTLGEDPSGPLWSAGLELRPGARTIVSARYRHRYDRDFWIGEGRWQATPTLQFAASHDESIYTYQELLSDRLGQLGVSNAGYLVDNTFTTQSVDEFGNPLNPLTAVTLDLTENTFGLIDEAFNRRYSQIRAAWTRPRDEVQAVVFRDERWSDASDYDQVTYGTSARWSHALSPVLSGSVGARYRFIDYGDTRDRHDNVYNAGVEMRYRLSETADIYGQYTVQYVDYGDSSNVIENLATVGLRKTF